MNFKFLGPQHRLTPFEFCICGTAYTSYKVHRETKHHKSALKEWRVNARRKQEVSRAA